MFLNVAVLIFVSLLFNIVKIFAMFARNNIPKVLAIPLLTNEALELVKLGAN